MKSFTIEVDADVYAFIKSKAEPFTDTPNSVLRRELLGTRGSSRPGRRAGDRAKPHGHVGVRQSPSGPRADSSIPAALSQVLEVARAVRAGNRDRNQATVDLANRLHVARETVADKYGRQLGLSTAAFDMLLAEPSLSGLERKLISKFADHGQVIRDALRPLKH